jgi:hypothetical protein
MKRAWSQYGGGGGGVGGAGGGEVMTLPSEASAASLKRVCGAAAWSLQMSQPPAPFQQRADEPMDEDAVDDEHFSEHYHAHKAWWHAQACGQCSQCSSCMLSAAV